MGEKQGQMKNQLFEANKRRIRELVIDEIDDQNDGFTDDMLVEAMENPEQTDEAIDRIIDYLEHIREEGI